MLKPYFNKDYIEAGLDEVGRGALAGPVVAAAVILPSNYANKWLNDSKKLNRNIRNELAAEIKKIAISYAIAQVSHTEIDQINILNASIKAMHLAVDELTTRPEHLLVDGNKFHPYPGLPHTCIVKGDSKFMSIAAASILAKVYRDELMVELHQQFTNYGWAKNMGYGTLQHRKAIHKFGQSPWHRLSFKIKE